MEIHSSLEQSIVNAIVSRYIKEFDSIEDDLPFVTLSSLLKIVIPEIELGCNEKGITISKDITIFLIEMTHTKSVAYRRIIEFQKLRLTMFSVLSFIKKLEANHCVSLVRQEDMDGLVDKCLGLNKKLLYLNIFNRDVESYIRQHFFSTVIPSDELIELYQNKCKSWTQLRAKKEDKISVLALVISGVSLIVSFASLIFTIIQTN